MHMHLENGISDIIASKATIQLAWISRSQDHSPFKLHIVYQYTQSKQYNDLRMNALRHDSILYIK